jgi:hypothetical protein
MEKAVPASNHEASSPEIMFTDPIAVLNKPHKEVPIVRSAIAVAGTVRGAITTVLFGVQ